MKVLLAIDGLSHSETAVAEVARRSWPSGTEVQSTHCDSKGSDRAGGTRVGCRPYRCRISRVRPHPKHGAGSVVRAIVTDAPCSVLVARAKHSGQSVESPA